ncbi:outer membrane beta-barrel protein [Halosquirtibacter xylanolyticus]|uniref:outer membrane beta-barrel protein n=1 Tax=Halosquirtibacter xylanolyticus TaxID=3374599 RepID=UPI0037487C6F|nr:outer membrane beta-barrel protein [Prolixibacteraceae bacterium]
MKLRSLLILLVLLCSNSIMAQRYAISKGAVMIGGAAGYTSISHKGSEISTSQLTLSPELNCFVANKFFIGGGIDFKYQSQGEASSSGMGIGPQIGAVFGNEYSQAFPFLKMGVRYYNETLDVSNTNTKISGSDFFFGGGVIISARDHLGITIEAGYHMMNLSEENYESSVGVNQFEIKIGFAGLLF